MSKTIYMLCGLPGCGKSTWAKQRKVYWGIMGSNTEIISTDSIRGELYGDESIQGDGKLVFDTAYKKIAANLNPFVTTNYIIFDATNLHRKDRNAFIKRFKKYNAKICLVYFDIPLPKCKYRNESRDRVVPTEVMERMWKSKDVPSLDEGFDEFIVVRA